MIGDDRPASDPERMAVEVDDYLLWLDAAGLTPGERAALWAGVAGCRRRVGRSGEL